MLKNSRQYMARSIILKSMEERRGLLYKISSLYAPGGIDKINQSAKKLADSPAFVRKIGG